MQAHDSGAIYRKLHATGAWYSDHGGCGEDRITGQPKSRDDLVWIIAPAHECPTVGTYSSGDFTAIFIILGFCRGKAHIKDVGTVFHRIEFLPRFCPCSRGNTLVLLGCFLSFMIRMITKDLSSL